MTSKELQKEELKVTIGEEPVKVPVKLRIRKSVDGQVFIRDHDRYEIVISPEEGLVKTYPKDEYTEVSFQAQQSFFKFLTEKGIIDRESIQGGNIYGSLQANIVQAEMESQDPIQLLIYVIYKFMEEERPKFRYTSDLLKQQIKAMTDPPEEEATDPYEVRKKEDKYRAHRHANAFDSAMGADYPYYGTYYY
jgi:hypothetical protein